MVVRGNDWQGQAAASYNETNPFCQQQIPPPPPPPPPLTMYTSSYRATPPPPPLPRPQQSFLQGRPADHGRGLAATLPAWMTRDQMYQPGVRQMAHSPSSYQQPSNDTVSNGHGVNLGHSAWMDGQQSRSRQHMESHHYHHLHYDSTREHGQSKHLPQVQGVQSVPKQTSLREYAQAGPPSPPKVLLHLTSSTENHEWQQKVNGSASRQRRGRSATRPGRTSKKQRLITDKCTAEKAMKHLPDDMSVSDNGNDNDTQFEDAEEDTESQGENSRHQGSRMPSSLNSQTASTNAVVAAKVPSLICAQKGPPEQKSGGTTKRKRSRRSNRGSLASKSACATNQSNDTSRNEVSVQALAKKDVSCIANQSTLATKSVSQREVSLQACVANQRKLATSNVSPEDVSVQASTTNEFPRVSSQEKLITSNSSREDGTMEAPMKKKMPCGSNHSLLEGVSDKCSQEEISLKAPEKKKIEANKSKQRKSPTRAKNTPRTVRQRLTGIVEKMANLLFSPTTAKHENDPLRKATDFEREQLRSALDELRKMNALLPGKSVYSVKTNPFSDSSTFASMDCCAENVLYGDIDTAEVFFQKFDFGGERDLSRKWYDGNFTHASELLPKVDAIPIRSMPTKPIPLFHSVETLIELSKVLTDNVMCCLKQIRDESSLLRDGQQGKSSNIAKASLRSLHETYERLVQWETGRENISKCGLSLRHRREEALKQAEKVLMEHKSMLIDYAIKVEKLPEKDESIEEDEIIKESELMIASSQNDLDSVASDSEEEWIEDTGTSSEPAREEVETLSDDSDEEWFDTNPTIPGGGDFGTVSCHMVLRSRDKDSCTCVIQEGGVDEDHFQQRISLILAPEANSLQEALSHKQSKENEEFDTSTSAAISVSASVLNDKKTGLEDVSGTDQRTYGKSSPMSATIQNVVDDSSGCNLMGDHGDVANIKKGPCAHRKTTLKRARTQLKKAMLTKKRALLARQLQQSNETLRPINALLKGGLDTLLVANIGSTGPPEKVRFAKTASLHSCEMSGSGSGDETTDIVSHSQDVGFEKVSLLLDKTDVRDNQSLVNESQSMSSSEREKIKETKLLVKLSRSDLELKRKEAERDRSISQYRHIISKQERLKFDQTTDMKKTKDEIAKCRSELHKATIQLKQISSKKAKLTVQKKILDALVLEHSSKILKQRKALYNTSRTGK